LGRKSTHIPEILAAVDLGSNSFHLVVARYSNGQMIVLDRMREMVRLAEGMDESGRLDKDVAARALACLRRFGQRLSDMHASGVRVVGTSALRVARRKQGFLERARDAIGHPIEIIAGREEARLIYSGVAHTMPTDIDRRLVVDIGGGSTEIIIGKGYEPIELESLNLGCVSFSERHFGDGKISEKRVDRARLLVRQELEPMEVNFRRIGWDQAVGSSGTIRAVYEAQRELDPATTSITLEGVAAILEVLVNAGNVGAITLATVDDERKPVFIGGVCILAEMLSRLAIKQMRVADGAMRDGLLYDMIGRYTEEDARERTVRSMQIRYQVDLAHAGRVEHTAVDFLEQVGEVWKLQDPLAELVLRWVCRLHEIGLDVAHSGFHRHSAYLLENADMPGFAREEQLLLARLAGAQRRKLNLEGLEDLIPPWDRLAIYLILILRLAVLLHRDRSEADLPKMELTAKPKTVELRFRSKSLRDRPLTAADLSEETSYLQAHGFRLRVFTS
jgi:exopolyphosphatase / guanosine-5'-triphosphate,3'-diphosphate pyrophosphatase